MNPNNYNLLEYFMEHVPDVIYFKDKKCRFILVNQAHAKSTGLKPEEIVGKTDFDIFPSERANKMFKDDLHVLNTGRPIVDKIERATRPDGIDNYVSTTKIPMYDEKGRIIGLLGITRDITRRVHIENARKENESITRKLHELKESEKIKPQVISVVSHELKAPLSIAKEAVKLVFEGRLGDVNHEQKKCLAMAMNNMDRIRKITGDLLDLSRIENKTLVLRYSLIDLKSMIKDLLPFFNKLALDKGISLECKFPKKQVNIFMDSDRIRQVFLNFINNAIKFTEENGKIKIEIKVFDNKIRVGIIDNGIGIAKEDIPRLFKKFVQLCQEKCADKTGVGLGLAISKQLVESHGGDVWVESKAGIGSRFYFTLPLCYAVNKVDNKTRKRINSLLERGTSAYLIRLLILNSNLVKNKVEIRPRQLLKALKGISNAAIENFFKDYEKNLKIIFKKAKGKEEDIIFIEKTNGNVMKLCELLKGKIKTYFHDNKIKKIFVHVGDLCYPSKLSANDTKKALANLFVKYIYIGYEIRRFKRIGCNIKIEAILAGNKKEACRAIDVSKGGLCVSARKPLDKNKDIKIRMKLSGKKRPINIKGRVRWMNALGEADKNRLNKYKLGIKFNEIGDRDKKYFYDFMDKLQKNGKERVNFTYN